MRRMFCSALLLFAISAQAQYPEVDSAREALMAKDIATLLEHLPVELQKAVSEFPKNEVKALEQEFVPSRVLSPQNIVIKRSESPDAVVIFERVTEGNSSQTVGTIV